MSRFLLKNYMIGSSMFAIYGMTRGYRSNQYRNYDNYSIYVEPHFKERIVNGIFNGIVYSNPFYQLYAGYQLYHRIQSNTNNFPYTSKHNFAYRELVGYCKDKL